MLVMTSAPIIEETSSANGKRKQNAKKVGNSFKRGYSRLKEAGGVPVIENLLGIGTLPDPNSAPVVGAGLPDQNPIIPTDETPKKEGLSKTTKIVLWSVAGLAVVGLGIYLYKRSKSNVSMAKIKA